MCKETKPMTMTEMLDAMVDQVKLVKRIKRDAMTLRVLTHRYGLPMESFDTLDESVTVEHDALVKLVKTVAEVL